VNAGRVDLRAFGQSARPCPGALGEPPANASVRSFARRDSILAAPHVSRIRRRRRRAPPRSLPPAAPGLAAPTGRSRCRPRWRPVPERPPGTPPPMPAGRRVGPASTSSQRGTPGSTLPRSTARGRQPGSSPRWARRPYGRTARPARDRGRRVEIPAGPRRLPASSPSPPTRRPRRQPCPTPGDDMGPSAPRQSMQH
jgi:hypothetical protein